MGVPASEAFDMGLFAPTCWRTMIAAVVIAALFLT